MYEAFSGVNFAALSVGAQAECGGMPGEACFWDRFASLQAMLDASARDTTGGRGESVQTETLGPDQKAALRSEKPAAEPLS